MIATILQDEPRKRIWLYFLDLRIRYALVLLFFGLLLAESTFGKIVLLAGLIWVAGALALGRIRPSDQEVDGLLYREVELVTEKARRSHETRGDEMRAAPLALLGPVERDAAAPAHFTRPRTGRDGGRRSPVNRVVVLLPLEDRLGVFSCRHDSLANRSTHVSAEQHNYRDVASVALEQDVEDGRDGTAGAPHKTQVFSLVLTSGQRLAFPVSVARAATGAGDEDSHPGVDRTVHAIQTLLRDHR